MKIRVVAVGKLKDKATRTLVDDYLRRLKRYCKTEEVELDPRKADAAKLDKYMGDAVTIALDVVGVMFTSRDLARKVETWAQRGKGTMTFLIGGADGLPKQVLDKADVRWSLSELTFPHRIARVLVTEQLYRAMTIQRGEPYDH